MGKITPTPFVAREMRSVKALGSAILGLGIIIGLYLVTAPPNLLSEKWQRMAPVKVYLSSSSVGGTRILSLEIPPRYFRDAKYFVEASKPPGTSLIPLEALYPTMEARSNQNAGAFNNYTSSREVLTINLKLMSTARLSEGANEGYRFYQRWLRERWVRESGVRTRDFDVNGGRITEYLPSDREAWRDREAYFSMIDARGRFVWIECFLALCRGDKSTAEGLLIQYTFKPRLMPEVMKIDAKVSDLIDAFGGREIKEGDGGK